MPRGVRLNPKHDERTRAKIQTSQIINRLTSFINGEVEMSAPQVTAALGLLKKSMPDLSAMDMKATIEEKRSVAELTDAELLGLISDASGEGTAQETAGPKESDPVH